MSHLNNWSDPSKASAQDIAEMARALEERGKAPDQQQVNSALMKMLAPGPGEHLLEAGCGTGLLCRSMATAVLPGGRITGLDISPGLLGFARDNARRARLADGMQWSAGRAEALPFPDGSFDGVLAARLLLHVSEPETVLHELTRVVRTGGRVVAMDWDFESVVVDHSNRELTRRLLHWRCDHYGGNNWSGRQLWKHMAAAGLSNLKLVTCASLARHEQDSLTLSLFRAAQVAQEGGAITLSEYEGWVGELKSALGAGLFCASITYFIVYGEK
jgi:ubiquinone/menaquinone biosynthesis C-methylase UbiE